MKIGSNCIIGANSLVNKDVPDNSVVAGIPARVIESFPDYIEKRSEQLSYPAELKPRKEAVSQELLNLLWERFEERREEE